MSLLSEKEMQIAILAGIGSILGALVVLIPSEGLKDAITEQAERFQEKAKEVNLHVEEENTNENN